jgi:hypothetical protein
MSQPTQDKLEKTVVVRTEYTTPYGALIRDDVVMGVPRYFLERWVPILGPAPSAVVNTLRQLDYRCHGDPLTIAGESLAREAAMSRRHLYTCLEAPWVAAFVRQESGRPVRDSAGQITQQPNRYYIRMDDPLSPTDADHLLSILTNLADTPLEAAQRALEIDARELWAPYLTGDLAHFPHPRAITAQDVLARAFPTWVPADADQRQGFARSAEALHRHMTLVRQDGKTSKIIVPQYFRKRWWHRLGHDLAWIYLWLRGSVYDNTEEGIRRDTCWVPSLDHLLTIIGRSREWWRRNVEQAKAPDEGWALTDFFEQLAAEKGRNPAKPQWVARQFRVALEIPVAPEDRSRHAELLEKWQKKDPEPPSLGEPGPRDSQAATGSATDEHIGSDGVRHISAHREPPGLPQTNTPVLTGSATNEHAGSTGVCHTSTQGSATSLRRETKSNLEALLTQENLTTSKQQSSGNGPDEKNDSAGAAARLTNPVREKRSLFEQLADLLENAPETPLYSASDTLTWLDQAWPEPVRYHSPVWNAAFNEKVSRRDLVALILAVWSDTTIKNPPRYLSWLIQRWQMVPNASPVNNWERWRALADLPLGDWAQSGRQEWDALTASKYRPLPFGLDAAFEPRELDSEPPYSGDFASGSRQDLPQKTMPDGLDERPGDGAFTISDIWIATLGQLSAQLNRSTYVSWVEGAKPVSYADGILTVRARHFMAREWLSKRLNHIIEETVSSLAQRPITIQYILDLPLPPAPMLPQDD